MSQINYTIKRTNRARRIVISVHSNTDVVVTMPMQMPVARAEHFVFSKMPWIVATQEKMRKKFEGKISLKQSRKEYEELKEQTRIFVEARLKHFNQHYNFSYKRISIRMQRSRWGSCSRKGNLNFNYKLIQLPQALADYIVVHELCHLKQFNHSHAFWNLVTETIPNHIELRKVLKNQYIHVS
jgi:predicted metal-dependent hydrolase